MDFNNPPRDFIDYAAELNDTTGVQCRACAQSAEFCGCEIDCCQTCGGPQVVVGGRNECPLCDGIPSAAKPAELYQAGEHPVFSGGNWMARVSAEVASDEEVTARTVVPSMAELVGGAR